MKIAIFGATGRVGRKVLQYALARGFQVKVLARTPDKLTEYSQDIEIIQGDYFNAEAVNQALEGVDAAVSTVGPPVNRKSSLTPDDFGRAMQTMVNVLNQKGIRRFVHLTSTGTSYPGEELDVKRKLLRNILSLISPVVIPAKEQELAVLRDSSLDWTCIRPPLITTAKGTLSVDSQKTQGFKVDTDQLAEFILDNLFSQQWSRKMPFVGTVNIAAVID